MFPLFGGKEILGILAKFGFFGEIAYLLSFRKSVKDSP